AKAPSDRYGTGDELAHDLAVLRAGPPAAELQATVPVSVPATSSRAMDVTLDSNPAALPTTLAVVQSAAALIPPAAVPPKKRTSWIGTPIGFIFAALLLPGGWYGYAN